MVAIFQALVQPLEAVLRLGFRPENEDTRTIFGRFEASRTWGSILTNKWSQLITEAALEKSFSTGTRATSPFRF